MSPTRPLHLEGINVSQNSGNPVLDSVVNLLVSRPDVKLGETEIRALFDLMLKLQDKERSDKVSAFRLCKDVPW